MQGGAIAGCNAGFGPAPKVARRVDSDGPAGEFDPSMSSPATGFDSIASALQDIAEGKLVIVTDDEGRENEGDLVMAASKATPETINMMIRFGSGIVCVPMMEAHLMRLGLGPMVARNRESQRTDYTVTVDAAEGISTGISAYDRAHTIRLLSDDATTAADLVQPGHVFPLRARPGGVLERAGHTEAAVDLATLAGMHPSGVICELVNEDGTMQRLPQLLAFKEKFGLKLISIAQLIEYRLLRDQLVTKICAQPFASEFGEFQLQVFRSQVDGRHHLAFTLGELTAEPTLVRVHRENLLSDLFRQGGAGQGPGPVERSMQAIAREGRGVLLYMEHAQGGADVIRRYSGDDPEGGMSFRDYGIGAQILRALGLARIRLLSNSQRRVVGLDGYGLEIVEQVAL